MPSKDEPRWPVPVNAESSHSHEAAVLDRLRAMRKPATFPFTGSLEEPLSVQRDDAQTLLTCLGRAVEELGFAASRGYEGGAGRAIV